MYETFYGLRKRPFAAAPDAEVTVETPAVADAIGRLDRCVRQGRGIAVLTAAGGMGKTHLCHRLARQWAGDYRVAVLQNAGFPTPRGLLQAILAELDQPYQRLGETELRLELTAVAKNARSETAGIVLLLDEAHRYSDRLLDEVRLIANLIECGEPLVRVVLAGQVELEERLSDPGLAGLNERVGEVVILPRLTMEESRRYLRERAGHAGGELNALFRPDAVEMVVQACGGTPRCLNQLADHGLLLGYVAERRPVDVGLVREALDDLKRLPLQWNDPLPGSGVQEDRSNSRVVDSLPPEADGVIEIGGLSDDSDAFGSDRPSASIEFSTEPVTCPASDDIPPVRETAPPAAPRPVVAGKDRPAAEPIRDRFARIDADEARRRWFEQLEQVEGQAVAPASPKPVDHASQTSVTATACTEERPTIDPLRVLDRIEPLVAEAMNEMLPLPEPRLSNDGRVEDGSRAELERIVSSLEAAADRETKPPVMSTGPRRREHRPSTLFRDLRRGRNRSGQG